MKVILRSYDICQMGNDGVWAYLEAKGMDMDKEIMCYPCECPNTIYGYCYEGTRKE